MDRIYTAVLEKINSLAPLGRYVIISAEEFTENFPEGADCEAYRLKEILSKLVSQGFIDLKYSGGDMFCVAPLKKYAPQPEPEPLPQPQVQQTAKIQDRTFITTFLSALLGSAAGSFIILLLFNLLSNA